MKRALTAPAVLATGVALAAPAQARPDPGGAWITSTVTWTGKDCIGVNYPDLDNRYFTDYGTICGGVTRVTYWATLGQYVGGRSGHGSGQQRVVLAEDRRTAGQRRQRGRARRIRRQLPADAGCWTDIPVVSAATVISAATVAEGVLMSRPQVQPAWSRDWSAPSDWDAPTGPIPIVQQQPQPKASAPATKSPSRSASLLSPSWAWASSWPRTE